MVIHIDTQLDTVFDLYNDKAKAEGITTEEADLRSTTQLGPEGSRCRGTGATGVGPVRFAL